MDYLVEIFSCLSSGDNSNDKFSLLGKPRYYHVIRHQNVVDFRRSYAIGSIHQQRRGGEYP